MGCNNSNDAKEDKKDRGGFPYQAIVRYDQIKVNNMMQWYIVDGNPSSEATTTAVNRAVAFFTRQSLERDGYSPDDFAVKVFSTDDPGVECNIQINGSAQSIENYGKVLQQFWEISYLAYEGYYKLYEEAVAAKLPNLDKITFSPELGLPMTTMTSIPLLFFPPNSTKYYSDYQYAQTVTAWWANMAHNGASSADMVRMARIVDITALVSTSTAASSDTFKFFVGKPEWDPYVEKQLDLYLGMNVKEGDKNTIPVIVMGTEPKEWLYNHYKTQIDEQLNPDKDPNYYGPKNNDVVVLKGVVSGKPDLCTPVMFGIHPSAILFSTNDPFADCLKSEGSYPSTFTKCMQGQIAAAWNVIMAKNPQGDALAAKKEAEAQWAVSEEEQKNGILDPAECSENKKRVLAALISKSYEFGYKMDVLNVTEAERENYVTDSPNVDKWVRSLVDIETNLSYYQLEDSRFIANKMLIAGNEPAAFTQFVTPATTDSVEADEREDTYEHAEATGDAKPMQIKIVAPRPWANDSIVQQITDQWNKDKLALHVWESQDTPGSVLTGGWVLPTSSHKKPE